MVDLVSPKHLRELGKTKTNWSLRVGNHNPRPVSNINICHIHHSKTGEGSDIYLIFHLIIFLPWWRGNLNFQFISRAIVGSIGIDQLIMLSKKQEPQSFPKSPQFCMWNVNSVPIRPVCVFFFFF